MNICIDCDMLLCSNVTVYLVWNVWSIYLLVEYMDLRYHSSSLMFQKGKLKSFLCGGTLVASKFIISAAHCFFDDKGVVEESRIKV